VYTSRTQAASPFGTPYAPITPATVRAGLLTELRGQRQQPAAHGLAWPSTARSLRRTR
jgi:hypothetical protein